MDSDRRFVVIAIFPFKRGQRNRNLIVGDQHYSISAFDRCGNIEHFHVQSMKSKVHVPFDVGPISEYCALHYQFKWTGEHVAGVLLNRNIEIFRDQNSNKENGYLLTMDLAAN